MGWVLRNWAGEIIVAGNKFVGSRRSIKMLETMTVLEDFKALIFLDSYPIRVETDSTEVTMHLQDEDTDLFEIVWIVNEIQGLEEFLGVFSVVKVDREANVCAHSLARKAFENQESAIWDQNIPTWLASLAFTNCSV